MRKNALAKYFLRTEDLNEGQTSDERPYQVRSKQVSVHRQLHLRRPYGQRTHRTGHSYGVGSRRRPRLPVPRPASLKATTRDFQPKQRNDESERKEGKS